MLIANHRGPQKAHSRPQKAESVTLHNEPIDGWDPTRSKAMAKLAPVSLGVLGTAAGVVAGLGKGVPAAIGGAVAVGSAAATLVTVGSAFAEMSGMSPNYKTNALIGAGVGAGLGAVVGHMSGSPWAAVGLGLAGLVGGSYGSHILSEF